MREPTAPACYDRRARAYDDWCLGPGAFATRDRPGFDDKLAAHFTPERLLAELGGGDVLFAGDWIVAVVSPR